MAFDIDGARKAGYSDGEIASFLGQQSGFDVDAATKAGYDPSEIVAHLSAQEKPKGALSSAWETASGLASSAAEKVGNEAGQLRDEFFTGIDNTVSAVKNLNTASQLRRTQQTQQRIKDLEAEGRGDSTGARALRGEVSSLESRLPVTIGEAAEAQSTSQRGSAMTTRPAVAKVGAAKTFAEAWDAFKEAPYDVIAGVTATSLPSTLPGLVAAAAMGPAAGAVTMGLNSATVEAGSSLGEFARDKGVDMTDAKAVQAFFSEPTNLSEAMSYAGKRAGIIGTLDAVSGGVASKTIAPALKSKLARQAVNIPAQMGVQAGLGAAGEAGGQLATKGTIDQPGQVLMEAAGELGGAPSEVLAFSKDARAAFKPGAPQAQVADILAAPDVDSAITAANQVLALPAPGTIQPGETIVADARGNAGTAAQYDALRRPVDIREIGAMGMGRGSDVTDVTPHAPTASVAGQQWQDIQADQQRASEEAGASASRATDERIAEVGQQWRDLGITDPQDDLQRQKTWGIPEDAEPASTWFGRRGDGYQTQGDASMALPTRQKIAPELQWRIEQMPSGKFRLAGYANPAVKSGDATAQPQALQAAPVDTVAADQLGGAPDSIAAPQASAQSAGNIETAPAVQRGDDSVPSAESAPPTFRLNPSGTLSVQGDPEAIRAALAPAGVTNMVRTADGVMVGVSQAKQAQQVLEQASAPKAEEPAEPAPVESQKPAELTSNPDSVQSATVKPAFAPSPAAVPPVEPAQTESGKRSDFENLSKAQFAAAEAFKDATPAVHRGEAERIDAAAQTMADHGLPEVADRFKTLAESHRVAADSKERGARKAEPKAEASAQPEAAPEVAEPVAAEPDEQAASAEWTKTTPKNRRFYAEKGGPPLTSRKAELLSAKKWGALTQEERQAVERGMRDYGAVPSAEEKADAVEAKPKDDESTTPMLKRDQPAGVPGDQPVHEVRKKSGAKRGNLSREDADFAVQTFAKIGAHLRIADTIADLPESGRQRMESEGVTGVRGMYDPQTDQVWIVRQNIASMEEAFFVGMHEAFHRGIGRTFGADVKPILNYIELNNKTVHDKAKAYAEQHKVSRLEAIEEVLADMAGEGKAGDVKGWDRLVKFLKDILAKIAKGLGINVPITDKMVEDLVAGVRRAGMAETVHLDTDGQAGAQFSREGLESALEQLRKADDLFAIPKSDKDTVEGVAADIAPEFKIRPVNGPGPKSWKIIGKDDREATLTRRDPSFGVDRIYGMIEGRGEVRVYDEPPGINPQDIDLDQSEVFIDVSDFKTGSEGGKVYAIAANYAHNIGARFIGDPATLSDEAMRRRLEQMISSALKFGTTDHLAPHPRQTEGDAKLGVPALRWVYGDHEGNIERMIDVSREALANAFPSSKLIGYKDGNFYRTDTGQQFADRQQLARLVDVSIRKRRQGDGANGSSGQAGWRSVARNALFGHLQAALSAAPVAERGRLLDRLSAERARLGRDPSTGRTYEAKDRVFYSRKVDDEVAEQGDSEKQEARFSRSVMTGLPLPQTWQGPDASKLDDFIYSLQDKHIDTKRAVQAVRDSIGAIEDAQDPYLQEELFHGRAAKATKDFLEKSIRPLLVDMQARGVALSDFEEYLHNRHAERRNVQVAKVNPKMQDGGSGIKTVDARAYLTNLPATTKRSYEALAKRIDQINRDTRQLLVDSGLEKQSTIDAWNAAYGDEYVPLMREEMDNGAMGIGQGYSVRGSASKRAMGSDKPVANILANIALQREKTITRANKRRIGEALYGLALKAPNDDFWMVVDPQLQNNPKQVLATSMQLISMGLDPADAESIAKEPTSRHIGADGKAHERINPALRSADNVLAVRIDGEDKYVFFNAKDPRAMRMVTALKNLDADQLGTVMGTVAKMTRYFAAINTQWNPIFGVTNFTRDVQTAALNLSSTPLAGHQAAVMKHVLPALRGIYIDLRDHRAGKPTTSSWAALFEEFQKEGGATGFRDMYANAQERADAITDELSAIKDGKLLKLGKGIMGWLSDYNETAENAVRLAAYKVGKDQGLSNQQAASVAKNLTVNFNRKGQVALQAGALYAFFNASVQGSARMAETMFKDGGLSSAGKKIIGGGLLLGSMQALLLAAAGFDDKEPPDFVRERALVIPIGGKKYIAIPMPLGYHVIPNMGRIPTEWAMSGFKDTTRRIAQLVGIIAEAFNPIGSAGLSLQTIAPTVIDPLAALAENKDWTGKPIAKKDIDANHPTAGHTRAKDTATPWAKLISHAVNRATGGTDFKPGVASPTPDQIDYLIGQVTGGVGREIGKAAQVAGGAMSGEEVPLHKIPLVGRFVGTTEGQAAEASRFYDNLREIGAHKVEIEGLRKAGRSADIAVYIKDNKEATLFVMADSVQRDVARMNKAKRELIAKDAPRERVKLIEDQITARMKLLNDRVRELKKKNG
jgi:hypothetical protein